MQKRSFNSLLAEVKASTLCADHLHNGVRPVLQIHANAKMLIAGQAPGSKVHASGIPFDDPSGDRLRSWMGIDRKTFYDETKIALLPMAFCYPGKGKTGDLPPMPICAETWRSKLLHELPNLGLSLIIGQYAQAWHLPVRQKTLTETVRNWRNYAEDILPLPHPSPRNNIWLRKNAWFETDVLPHLKQKVERLLA